MNASALVQSPLKTSGRSPIGLASWARGTGHKLGGRFGPAGAGSPPAGGPRPPSPPPPPGGPPPLSYGLHSGGWLLSLLSVRLNTLSKVVASFSSIPVLVWVTMAGG